MTRCLTVAALRWVLLVAILAAVGVSAEEADRFADVQVKAQPVNGNVYVLMGAGGNIGATIGSDGTLIIDDEFQPLAGRIQKALTELNGDAPKLIINTHFHGDHTGGNPVFGETGTIIAQDNVRTRLAAQTAFPPRGLPIITYTDRITVHFNGDTLDVIHLPPAHTDGDSVVWFHEANVLHTGDLLFNGAFPVIDLSHGGSVQGMIDDLGRLIDMVPDDIHIIPGHGPLATKDDMKKSRDMIRETRAEVTEALGRGMSVDDIVAHGLAARWKPWGQGFVDEERWIRTLAAGAATGSETP